MVSLLTGALRCAKGFSSGLNKLERENDNFFFMEQKNFYDWGYWFFSDSAFHLNANGAARLNTELAGNLMPEVIKKLKS